MKAPTRKPCFLTPDTRQGPPDSGLAYLEMPHNMTSTWMPASQALGSTATRTRSVPWAAFPQNRNVGRRGSYTHPDKSLLPRLVIYMDLLYTVTFTVFLSLLSFYSFSSFPLVPECKCSLPSTFKF